MCGDLNARIGNRKDILLSVADIKDRETTDTTVNSHGRNFLDFLNDACCCVVNGRCGPAKSTCINVRGTSVVDYVFVPYNVLANISSLEIIACPDIVSVLKIENLVGDKSQMPDHCMLTFEFKGCGTYVEEFVKGLGAKEVIRNKKKVLRKYNRNYMTNPRIRDALLSCINDRLTLLANQEEVDDCYDELCKIVMAEMGKYAKIGKRKYTPHKEYWSDRLSELWAKMKENYKNVQKKGSTTSKRMLNCARERAEIEEYKQSVKAFDKELRNAKRAYRQGYILKIDGCLSKNPNQFWEEVNRLGPRVKKKMVCETIDTSGEVTRDQRLVMAAWFGEYQKLYGNLPDYEFQDEYLSKILEQNRKCGEKYDELLDPYVNLNDEITCAEVVKAVTKSKNNKAVGCDSIPYEALKNDICVDMLTELCNKCFQLGKLPNAWSRATICPIPKGSSSVSTVPLSFRGIALQSCVYKIFSFILNTRLSTHVEENGCLSNMQNGFRKNRSCSDHVMVLTETIRHHLAQSPSNRVYCAFVDKKKAFDYVNITLLERKLRDCGVQGKLLKSYLAIYASLQYSILVNGEQSDYFNSVVGLKQGDNSSPLLYSIFNNDLLKELQSSRLGLKIREEHVSVLAYADDLVLLSDSPEKLQRELNILSEWCRKNRMVVNEDKTKIVVFKRRRATKTIPDLWYRDKCIEVVDSYKYLGVPLDENLTFEPCKQHLSAAAGRALGSLINRTKNLPALSAKTYTKLYHSCVASILDYSAEVWGIKDSKTIEDIQSRAIRYFLGTGRYTAIDSLNAEMGWKSSWCRRQIAAIRYYNRITKMELDRWPRKVYEANKQIPGSWYHDVGAILEEMGFKMQWESGAKVNMRLVEEKLCEKHVTKWRNNVLQKPKLMYYRSVKTEYGMSLFVRCNMKKNQRSLLSRLRNGSLQLRLETGRYIRQDVSDRICELCLQSVETPEHFLYDCKSLEEIREKYKGKIDLNKNCLSKLFEKPFVCGDYVEELWLKRQETLYEVRK